MLTGRIAAYEDVREGRAVFYLQNALEIGAAPIPMQLPACAKLHDGEGQESVVVIQAEEAEGRTYIGFRFIAGGNGVATLEELEFCDSHWGTLNNAPQDDGMALECGGCSPGTG